MALNLNIKTQGEDTQQPLMEDFPVRSSYQSTRQRDGSPLHMSGAWIQSRSCLGQGPDFTLIGHVILRWLPLLSFIYFSSFTEDDNHAYGLGFHKGWNGNGCYTGRGWARRSKQITVYWVDPPFTVEVIWRENIPQYLNPDWLSPTLCLLSGHCSSASWPITVFYGDMKYLTKSTIPGESNANVPWSS